MIFRPPNPFRPSAGASPPELIGRGAVLAEFGDSLDDGPGAPLRLSLVTGARGMGKTVMLTEMGNLAAERGWVVISETATPGLVPRLVAALQAWARQVREQPRRRIRSVQLPSAFGVGGGGFAFEDSAAPTAAVDLRAAAGQLLDILSAHETGLLFTVDEIHHAVRDEIRVLATSFQHLVRERQDVALAMAGLPAAISDLLNDDVITFLRRAVPIHLTEVPLTDVREALHRTITESGRTIDAAALDLAVEATEGYPYLIQLVGYHVWRSTTDPTITVEAARAGIAAARERMDSNVLAAAVGDLSDMDRVYLMAMAMDDGPSRTGDIAQRIGRTRQYGNMYRARLMEAGVIMPAGHGLVDFAMPHLREFIRARSRWETE